MSDNTKDKSNVNKKKSFGKLQEAVLLRTVLPMLIMGIVIVFGAISIYKNSIKQEIVESLQSVTDAVIASYENMYPGEYQLQENGSAVSLYKGEKELTGDHSYLDAVSESNSMQLTLFYGNTRILTTLRDKNGDRYIVTGLNAAIYNEICDIKTSLVKEVNIEGKDFYACYTPIIDKNDEVICIVGAAKPLGDISESAVGFAIPLSIVTVVMVIISAIISNSYTSTLISSIEKIGKFLNGMIKGELSNKMPGDVLKRNDELGTTAKSVVEMQNAIRVLVEKDPLTQLYNRRYGGARLRKIQSSSEKSGVPFSVVMGDIDFFKKVNDTYGHEAGDIVLKKVAETMRKYMAGKGFVVRWGGEEFVLVFSKTNGADTAVLTNQLLEKIREIVIVYNGLTIKVTMTFGVVDGGISPEFSELLKKADERLYAGKQNGRNRVIVSDEVVGEESSISKPAESNSEANKLQPSTVDEVKDIILGDDFVETLIERMTTKIVDAAMQEEYDEHDSFNE